MKILSGVVLASVATLAMAQGAPTVNEQTGDLQAGYSFSLPRARGRFQPTLSLQYSSSSKSNVGYGWGWSVNLPYVEQMTRSSPVSATVIARDYLWVSLGGGKSLFVPATVDSSGRTATYRAEVEREFVEVAPRPAGYVGYSARDASGNAYTFARQCGARFYLTEVRDLDGNVALFEFAGTACSSGATDLAAIRYNAYGSASYAHAVSLEYETGNGGLQVDAGVALAHPLRLAKVRVTGPARAGGSSPAVIRSYQLGYSTAPHSGADLLTSVREYGGDFALAQPPTLYDYAGPSAVYRLDAGVLVSGADAGFANLVDFDGDGRPDWHWNAFDASGASITKWARNVSPPGAPAPVFAAALDLSPGCVPNQDFNNDGIPDCVTFETIASYWDAQGVFHPPEVGQLVYLGGISATGSVTYTKVFVDALGAEQVYLTWWEALPIANRHSMRTGIDLNGDGIPDITFDVPGGPVYPCGGSGQPACGWHVWLGYRGADGVWGYSPYYAWTPSPYAPGMAVPFGPNPQFVDVNGDGLPDTIAGGATSLFSGMEPLSGLGGLGPAVTSPTLQNYGDIPTNCLGLETNPSYDCPTVRDTSKDDGTLVDLDGDGLPDNVGRTGTGGLAIFWNDGRGGYRGGDALPLPMRPGVGVADLWPAQRRMKVQAKESDPPSPDDYLAFSVGDDGKFMDVNGDGVPDYVHVDYSVSPPRVWFYRGRLTAGEGGPDIDAGQALLLRTVTTPAGAVHKVGYHRSTEFGARAKSARPVVVSLQTQGRGAIGAGYVSTIEPNTVRYWYADAAASMAWDDPVRFEDRGFGQTWVMDDVSRTVKRTVWRTDFHDLMGMPRTVEVGSYTGADAAGRPLYATYQGTEYAYAVKKIGQTCDPGLSDSGGRTRELVAADYPARVVQAEVTATTLYSGSWGQSGSVAGKLTTSTQCNDVDQYGNVARTTVTTSMGGVAASGGPVTTIYDRWGATSCVNVPSQLTVTKTAGGMPLTSDIQVFDSKCNLVEQWAGDIEGVWKTKRVQYTYAGCAGQRDSTRVGAVTRFVSYDAYCLNLVQELQSDADATLMTTSEYDAATGLKLWEKGPELTAKAAYTGTLPIAGIERYYTYDLLGRVVAVSKAAPTGTGTGAYLPNAAAVPSAVEAYQYFDLDQATGLLLTGPRSAVSYRFATLKSLALGQAPPAADDSSVVFDYFDELGRKIQSRERLGCSSGTCAADAGAQITQSATSFRVVNAVNLDGAGRARWAIEPFFDTGSAFQTYNWDAVGAARARGTFTRFDERGRPTCKLYLPTPLNAALDGTCLSDSSEGAGFRLATQFAYSARWEQSRGAYGGYLAAVETVPPELASAGNTARFVSLLGPMGEEIGSVDADGNYVWVERDALNREVASWRVSASGGLSTERPAGTTAWAKARNWSQPEAASWIIYNLAGQIFESWDANTGMRSVPGSTQGGVRRRVYDEAGNLVNLIVDTVTGDAMEYVFGSLGRVTEVREVTYPVSSGISWQQKRLVARNHYDTPFLASDPAYSHTPGQLSWTGTERDVVNGAKVGTTIAYGYDDALRIAVRDQWFDALDKVGEDRKFRITTAYGADGRVLNAGKGANALGPAFSYSVYYESGGRPAEVRGIQLAGETQPRAYWKAVSQAPATGAYDPLGRLAEMEADGGNVKSKRTYGPQSGRLLGESKYLTAGAGFFTTTGATYRGSKLASFRDDGTLTAYAYDYTSGGKMRTATAAPDAGSTPGTLAQDYAQGFTFNGVGNLDGVTETANSSAASQAAGRVATTQATAHVYLSPAAGQVTDQVTRISTETWQSGRPVAAQAGGDTSYAYDFQNHLTAVTRTAGQQEKLFYGPTGELLYRQVDERFIFYVGPYATVTASGLAGCLGTQSCTPVQGFDVDNHVIFAATRIASVRSGASTNRVLYYYRTRLGSVVATTTRTAAGTQVGARYRYTPYGKVEARENETADTRSELGYTDALALTGDLVYLKARVYDAGLRRFIQADEVDRLRYAYVLGDPANLHDPTGLMARYFDTWWLPPVFLSTTQAEQAKVDAAWKAKDAESDGPNPNPGQASAEQKDISGSGLTAEQNTGDQGQSVIVQPNQSPSPMAAGTRTPARGEPDTTVTYPGQDGNSTDRHYGPDGRAVKDVDTGHDHGAGDPHEHHWDWSGEKPRRGKAVPPPAEKPDVAQVENPPPVDSGASRPGGGKGGENSSRTSVFVVQAGGATFVVYVVVRTGLRILVPITNAVPVVP